MTDYRDLFILIMVIAVLAAGAMTVDHFYGPKDN